MSYTVQNPQVTIIETPEELADHQTDAGYYFPEDETIQELNAVLSIVGEHVDWDTENLILHNGYPAAIRPK